MKTRANAIGASARSDLAESLSLLTRGFFTEDFSSAGDRSLAVGI